MKVIAGRRRDADDIRFLLRHLGITTVGGAPAIVTRVFPDEPVPVRSRFVLEDAIDDPPQHEGFSAPTGTR